MSSRHSKRTNKSKGKEKEVPIAWSEFAWDEEHSKWKRYRMFRGEYKYDWQDLVADLVALEVPIAWSEFVWDEEHGKWKRYRMFRGEYEYNWQDLEPSTLEDKRKDKGRGQGKEVKKKAVISLSVVIYQPIWGNLHH
jgi:hypothetical protein